MSELVILALEKEQTISIKRPYFSFVLKKCVVGYWPSFTLTKKPCFFFVLNSVD